MAWIIEETGQDNQSALCIGDDCGTRVTKHLNKLFQDEGIESDKYLPSNNLGVGIPGHISSKFGVPLLEKGKLTPDALKALGPGTAIAYTRPEAHPDRKYGATHAEVTEINPETGELMVASKSAGRGILWKPINQAYVNRLPENVKASNPWYNRVLETVGNVLGPASAEAATTKNGWIIEDAPKESQNVWPQSNEEAMKIAAYNLRGLTGYDPKKPKSGFVISDEADKAISLTPDEAMQNITPEIGLVEQMPDVRKLPAWLKEGFVDFLARSSMTDPASFMTGQGVWPEADNPVWNPEQERSGAAALTEAAMIKQSPFLKDAIKGAPQTKMENIQKTLEAHMLPEGRTEANTLLEKLAKGAMTSVPDLMVLMSLAPFSAPLAGSRLAPALTFGLHGALTTPEAPVTGAAKGAGLGLALGTMHKAAERLVDPIFKWTAKIAGGAGVGGGAAYLSGASEDEIAEQAALFAMFEVFGMPRADHAKRMGLTKEGIGAIQDALKKGEPTTEARAAVEPVRQLLLEHKKDFELVGDIQRFFPPEYKPEIVMAPREYGAKLTRQEVRRREGPSPRLDVAPKAPREADTFVRTKEGLLRPVNDTLVRQVMEEIAPDLPDTAGMRTTPTPAAGAAMGERMGVAPREVEGRGVAEPPTPTATEAVEVEPTVEIVKRSYSPGRKMQPYERNVPLINKRYTVSSNAVKGDTTDARGHKAVWIVRDDVTGKVVQGGGGWDTKKEAIEYAKTLKAPEAVKGKAKEPWEMTREEYYGKDFNASIGRGGIVERPIAIFRSKPTGLGRDYSGATHYTTDIDKAKTYEALYAKKPGIIEFDIKPGTKLWNVLEQGAFEKEFGGHGKTAVEKAIEAGYDGINKGNGEIVIFDKSRIIKGKVGETHKEIIERTLTEGLPVPPEVLAEYPDLAGKIEKPETKLYSGGPDTNEFAQRAWDYVNNQSKNRLNRIVDHIKSELKTGKDIQEKYHNLMPAPSDKDMSAVGQFFRLPSWVPKDHPLVRPLWSVARHVHMEVPSYYRVQAARTLEPFWRLQGNPEAMGRVNEWIWKIDKLNWDKDTPPAEMTEAVDKAIEEMKATESPEVYQAYVSLRRYLDDAGREVRRTLESRGVPKSDIDKEMREAGYLPGYFPHYWDGLKYYVTVLNPADPKGAAVYRTTASSRLEVGAITKDIKKNFPDIDPKFIQWGKNEGLPEDVFIGLSPAKSAQLAQESVRKANIEDPAAEQKIMSAMAETLKARGFGRHHIYRNNVPGFIQDPNRLFDIVGRHVSTWSGFLGKLKASDLYMQTLADMRAAKNPRLYSWAQNYVANVLENSGRFDNVMGKVRGLQFLWYISGVFSTGFLNLTQNFTTFIPELGRSVKSPYSVTTKAMADITADAAAFHRFSKGREANWTKLTPDETQAMDTILKTGNLEDLFAKEMMGRKLSSFKVVGDVQDSLNWWFGNTEKFNRTSAALAGYRAFRDKGLPFEEAVNKTIQLIDDTHFVYGKFNLPEFARLGNWGKFMRGTAYTFKQFPHNYGELMRQWIKGRDYKAVAQSLAPMVILGGMTALPFANILAEAYKAATGKEVLQEAFAGEDKEKSIAYTLARYGLPGLLGVDFSGAVAVDPIRTYTRSPEEFFMETMLGPIGGYVGDLTQAYKLQQKGQTKRVLELAFPRFAKTWMRGYREMTEGVKTGTGTRVLDVEGQPIKITPKEFALRGLGFQTTSTTTKREVAQYMKDKVEVRGNYLSALAADLVEAKSSDNAEKYENVWKELDAYNEMAGEKNLPKITDKDLKTAAKRRSKGRRAVPKYMEPIVKQYQGVSK